MNNNLFQLDFPDAWKETTVYTFEGPYDSGVQHNLAVVVDPFILKDMTVEEYARRQIEGPRSVMPGFDLVSEKEKKLPDGTPVYEIVYRYVPAENVELFQKQMFIKRDGKAFVFTATFTKKTLATVGSEVDKIIASFKMLKPVENDFDED